MKKYLLPVFSVLFLSNIKATIPTWSQDIAPILYANCTKCHNPNGAGHFSLLNYSDAYTYAYSMASDVSNGIMPPWPPNENYKHFVAERVLSAADITKINDWVTGGRLQGDITLAPAQPTYTNGSQLGTVDLSVVIPTYTVGANNDVYRNFPIPSGLLQGKYVTAIEVIPGNTHIVHHVLVFQDSTTQPATLDAAQAGPGYTNAGGTGSVASKLMSGWTPGASPYYTPVGTGFRLPANTNIVVQVHYPAGSQGLVDSTRINFKLTSVAQREITVWPILNHLQNITPTLNIPANTTKTFTESAGIGSGNYTFLSAFPHMHLIGKTIKSFATTTIPNDTIRFVDVPDWDFHWQDTYVFPNALKVPANSTLKAIATYDNTTNNVNNPSTPPQNVVAGEATTDEMMMVFFAYLPYQSGDENLIVSRRIIPQGATTFCNGQQLVLKTIEGTGYTYQWYRNGVSIANATALSYTATQAGNYHVLISLGPNSSLSDTIAVSVNSSPTATATAAGSTNICPGSAVTLNASTGSGYTYQWLNNGTPISGATAASYSANAAGSYTVQVYNGCYAASSAVNVSVATAPANTVTPTGATTFCAGGSVTLNAAAGLTYHWSNNATTQNITVNQNGSYAVTVTDANSCTAASGATLVTVNALPSNTVTINGNTTFCAGGSVSLSAPAGLTYNWSTGANTQTISATQSGSYLVTVTNANNCSAVSTATTVTVNPLPSATVTPTGATVFCQGGSVTLNALAGLTYHWSNNATTQNITVNQSGSYAVTVTGANSCSAASTATIVTVNTLPSNTVTVTGSTTFCAGNSVNLSAPAGLTYHWSTGATTQAISATQSGSYLVTVTNGNNCSAVSTATTVTVNPLPSATVTPSGATTFCDGGSVTLNANSSAAYHWSTSATTPSITVNQSGNYLLTVTDANSCSNTASLQVTVLSAPDNTVLTDKPTTICPGDSVLLSVPSQAAQSYLWSNSATTQSISVSSNGTYVVTITGFNSCTSVSNPITVAVSNSAVAGITPSGATTFCAGGSVQLTASTGSAYQWSTNETTSSITVTAGGTYTVSVTVSGSCTAVSTPVSVIVNPLPVATISSSDDSICGGDLVTFTALPAGYDTYSFYDGGSVEQSTASNTWTSSQLAQGNSVYCVATNNGCSGSWSNISTTFIKPTPFVVLSAPGLTICQGDLLAVQASPSGLDSYNFSINGTSVQNTSSDSYSTSAIHNGDVITTTGVMNGCVSLPSASLTISVLTCTGIAETTNEVFTIMPNPNNGSFEIRLSDWNSKASELTLFDVSGKLVFASLLENQQTQIDLGRIISGCYLIQIKTNNGILHRKLIISQ